MKKEILKLKTEGDEQVMIIKSGHDNYCYFLYENAYGDYTLKKYSYRELFNKYKKELLEVFNNEKELNDFFNYEVECEN